MIASTTITVRRAGGQVMADHHVEDRHFPLGPKLGVLLALYAFGVIFFAGILGEGYWATVLLETGISVLIYLLLGLALTQQWHESRYHLLFIVSGLGSAVGLLVAGGFANPG
jgi:hypothetical protein